MIDLPILPNEPMPDAERQVAIGFGFCHNQINALARQLVSAAAEASAVASLLQERGLITQEELDAHRIAEHERIASALHQDDIGVAITHEFPDKYAIPSEKMPEIDCDARHHLCHGACCALRFPLSSQDLEEGVVRWDLGVPYLNRQSRVDRRCVHQHRATYQCSIYEHRPGICRAYSCKNDTRIWLDFENRVINPDLFVEGSDGTLLPQFPKGLAGAAPDMRQASDPRA